VDFTTLLAHHTFHLSLLGCAMEIVLYSYRVIEAAFPTILSLFSLHAFDLCKVIESVIRYESTLPRPIIHHLIRIEETIVETLAWTDSSPLFSLLAEPSNRAALLLQQKCQTMPASSLSVPAVPPGPPFSPGKLLSSTRYPSIPPLQFYFCNTARPTQVGGTPQARGPSHSLQVKSLICVSCLVIYRRSVQQHFFRKLFQLASERCRNLCTHLQIRPEIFQQVTLGCLKNGSSSFSTPYALAYRCGMH
jgi:hypothetical protein